MTLPIGIQPVEDAFLSGTLEMSNSVDQFTKEIESGDPASVIISLALTMVIIGFLTNIGTFAKLLPKLSRSLINKNISFNLEHNERNVKSRMLLALLLAFPLSLEADNFGLTRLSFLGETGHVWRTLILFAFLVAFFLLRKLISTMPRPRRCSPDIWKSVSDGWLSNFVIFAILAVTFGLLVYICHWPPRLYCTATALVFAFFLALSLLKNYQILREYCSVLGSILYLCALEFLPTGALVALCLI